MSVYEPLNRHLRNATGDTVPMTFAEIEAILGRPLPPSARRHPAWWSNNVGTHVNAAAWRNAGWRTSGVSVPDERVTFVRETASPKFGGRGFPPHAGVAEANALEGSWDVQVLETATPAARRMVEAWSEERRITATAAILEILDAAARDQQRRLVASLPTAVMPLGHDSTALIREDRDSH